MQELSVLSDFLDLFIIFTFLPTSRFFSKTGDTDMNGPVMREPEMLVLGELPC